MDTQLEQTLSQAFHLMFDHYPEAAQLTFKDKRIVALNPACQALGREVGMFCAKNGSPEAHKGCMANKMLKNGQAIWTQASAPNSHGQAPVVFWLPVEGHPEYYIHFGVGITVDYSKGPAAKQSV
jgi:hypothetical protein